jgi:glucose/arabinose dehydrogenase
LARPQTAPPPAVALAAVAFFLVAASCGSPTTTPSTPGTPAPTACAAGTPVPGTPALTTVRVVGGLNGPLDLQAVPGDRTRLFVVEQGGRILIIRNGAIVPTPFLDVSNRIRAGGEQGLLGLAFHPSYAQNGRFFVNYTDTRGDTHVAEFRVTANPDVADPASERLLLFVDQPFDNHNGGGLAFGTDGKLYLGLGDGGSGGDPMGNGQSLGTHLGKMLRIDVDAGTPYGVPADNPFTRTAGARPEIWAFGLRNPWRFAFDRMTGDLVIADVGQSAVEEVDIGLASRHGGENYGWNVTEGSRCYRPANGCNMTGLTLPVAEYTHADGCSITGGVVYRGCRLPGYQGTYFYGDYCSGIIRSFRLENGRAVDSRDWTSSLGRGIGSLSSFGVDADGEAYMVDHDGAVYRIVPGS